MESGGNITGQGESSKANESLTLVAVPLSPNEGSSGLVEEPLGGPVVGQAASNEDKPRRRRRPQFGEGKVEEEEEEAMATPVAVLKKMNTKTALKKGATKKGKMISQTRAGFYEAGSEEEQCMSSLRAPDLDRLHVIYHIPLEVVIREPLSDEAACSDASPVVCLYEHMF